MTDIRRIRPAARMSKGSVHQGVVYLAGQVAEDAKKDIAGQTASVLAVIDSLLAEAGSDKSHILMAQIFIADMADFEAMNVVWDAWVSPGHAPSRATVESQLARAGWKIEIVVTAAVAGA